MVGSNNRVFLLHNIIAPYRLPLFEKLNEKFDLTVFFCKEKKKDRKWGTSLSAYSFKNEILKSFDVGPYIINYSLFLKLLYNMYDVYLVGENPEIFFSVIITLFFAKLYHKPFILWSGELETKYSKHADANSENKKVLSRIYREIVYFYRRILYSQADAFIAYCQKAKDFLIKSGVPEEKLFIGGQVMPEELLPKASVNKSERRFKNKKIVLYLGYLQKRKGVEYLIKAYKNLKNKNSALIIAGSGPDEERLKSLVGNRNDIHFVGHVNGKEKAKYCSLADIFVFPTLHDPWGLVVNEAIYYGLPVIITTAAGASDLINEAENGYVIKPADVNALKNTLNELLNKDELRKEMSKRSYTYVEKYCTTDMGVTPFVEAIKFVKEKKRYGRKR